MESLTVNEKTSQLIISCFSEAFANEKQFSLSSWFQPSQTVADRSVLKDGTLSRRNFFFFTFPPRILAHHQTYFLSTK